MYKNCSKSPRIETSDFLNVTVAFSVSCLVAESFIFLFLIAGFGGLVILTTHENHVVFALRPVGVGTYCREVVKVLRIFVETLSKAVQQDPLKRIENDDFFFY